MSSIRGQTTKLWPPLRFSRISASRTASALSDVAADVAAAWPGVASARRDSERLVLTTAEPERVLRRWLADDPHVSDLRVEGAGLEEALLALTTGAALEVAA